MNKHLGRGIGIVLLVLSLWVMVMPEHVQASGTSNSLGTEVGIGFSSDSTTPSSSSKKDNLPAAGGGSTGGKLPQTGELTTPFILLLVGWAIVLFTVTLYMLVKKNKDDEELEGYE